MTTNKRNKMIGVNAFKSLLFINNPLLFFCNYTINYRIRRAHFLDSMETLPSFKGRHES